jgi:hypothetical protein
MKLSQLFTGGAMAALAAALAFTAIPAQAQDNDRRGWRTSQSDDRSSARSERRSERRAERAERRAERPAARSQRTERRAQRPAAQQQRAAPQRAAQQRAAQQRAQRRAEATQQRSTRDRNRSERRDNRTASRGGWNTGNAPVLRSGRNPTYVDPNRNVSSRDRDGRRDGNRNWRDGRRDNDRNWRDGRRDNDRNWRDGRRDNDRRWDRRWRDNNRYNWYTYRNHNRNIFRSGHYYSPYRNYNYRRLSIGVFLDSLFYSNRYWINEPWQYRLPDVYGPYRWVRYYDDALLVDVYSGEVVDVIHDFFW